VRTHEFSSTYAGASQNRSYAITAINAIIDSMASITIRRLPENTKRRLRIRAARNGRSMEQEARELLETGLARADAEPENLGESIRRYLLPWAESNSRFLPPRQDPRDQFRVSAGITILDTNSFPNRCSLHPRTVLAWWAQQQPVHCLSQR